MRLTEELKNIRIQFLTITQDKIITDGCFLLRVYKAIRLGLRLLSYYELIIVFSYQEFKPPS
ncbi:MAG: hypothetical protein ACTS7E_04045 [Arsenophonus sp. NC-CH8-MAG3]